MRLEGAANFLYSRRCQGLEVMCRAVVQAAATIKGAQYLPLRAWE